MLACRSNDLTGALDGFGMSNLIVKLEGEAADEGTVPAFAALESMEGFAQAVSVILHYAETGEVRRRRIKELNAELSLVATREGSFEFLFSYPEYAEFMAGFIGNAVAGGITWDLIKRVFLSATGQGGRSEIDDDKSIPAGDFGALVQATEAAIRKSHNVVNHGSSNVTIFVNGDSNTINLNSETKAYMHESVFNDEARSQRFLVTSFDGRNRTGRMFDLEAEQAYTFELLNEADRESLETIVAAASAFALREKGRFGADMEVVAKFSSIDAPDGRTKRLKVMAARKDYSGLNEDDFLIDDE